MDPKIIISIKLLVATLVFFGLFFSVSCDVSSGRKVPNYSTHSEISDSFNSFLEVDFENQSIQLNRKQKKLHYESSWLKLREQIVRAKLRLIQSELAENNLAKSIAMFESLDRGFPNNGGFMSEKKKLYWEVQLRNRQEDCQKARAEVSLLLREMKELRYEVAENGFSAPPSGVIK